MNELAANIGDFVICGAVIFQTTAHMPRLIPPLSRPRTVRALFCFLIVVFLSYNVHDRPLVVFKVSLMFKETKQCVLFPCVWLVTSNKSNREEYNSLNGRSW